MTELEQYLRGYMGVSDEDMQALVSAFYPETLEKGDFFLRSGRVCEKLSFHREGLMRVFAVHGEKEVTQWISFRGNFITDLQGIVCDEPARFTMQALTRCELFTIDKKEYLGLHRHIARWPELERVLITRCFGFLETRIFSLLSMSGEERYSYLQGQNPELFDTVPLKYLASMIGMTPESLSRIRKKK
ncbi:Crp/Fnr family transcriptional regulator [Puia dinghuensis]|uniref:Cyclic nucleotide-binding protein n=1 Tax=Puia dinghuensis TaxID=1792502 RepID=A0A8J2UHK5_9BACT|nr:cyclic nucleotide-binding domain-containing protein [Puia dinghuensis]GGB18067.1 cyclic nucleotide-binding protein [Puia dinghuensis]